jgi:hypothetical protein
MGRKKKRKKYPSSPIFLFTPETINLTLEAIKRFEQPLERATQQDDKITFAIEETRRVKAMLEAMRIEAEAGHMRVAAFDYNDKVLLVTAIQMYTFDLNMQPASPRQAWELEQCRRIAAYFAPNRPNEQAGGENVL